MSEGHTSILSLDPSTEVTGAAIVEYSARGEVLRSLTESFDAGPSARGSDLSARIERIRFTRASLARYLTAHGGCIDFIAYEADTGRGHASSEALKMAAGAYLSLSHLRGIPLMAISRGAACKAAGVYSVYRQPAGSTYQEKRDKTIRLKRAVIAWANSPPFSAGLAGDDDAIADALAVNYAAYRAITAPVQRPLFGKGSQRCLQRVAAPGQQPHDDENHHYDQQEVNERSSDPETDSAAIAE